MKDNLLKAVLVIGVIFIVTFISIFIIPFVGSTSENNPNIEEPINLELKSLDEISILLPNYSIIKPFTEGMARVRTGGKWGYIDKYGKEVVPCKYEYADAFSEGLAAVQSNGNWGYIDKSGNIIIPCQFDSVEAFSEDLAKVKLNGKWGYIDKGGTLVIPCQFDSANDFSGGLAKVRVKGGRYIEINKDGEDEMMARARKKKQQTSTQYTTSKGLDERLRESAENLGRALDEAWGTSNNDDSMPMKICETCNGTGRITIGGGGMALGSQTCPSCGGTGKVFDAFGNMFNR